MLESLPLKWLVDQSVPLVFFIIALLTHPREWSRRLSDLAASYLGNSNTNDSN
jgi:hypothetical protein